ncbi:SpoIIE family protein phosphatase [Rhodopirellula sp. JC639]|uniref:SpoIIE family protein phosphatase n=1 Tax=Stieleria mannarensis TaxID=2755585 RepID=UPI0016029B04
MSTPVPSYLRLHLGEDAQTAARPGQSSSDQFWSAFSAATGWRIDDRHKADGVQVLPAVQMDVMADDPADSQPPVVKETATELASVARAMATEIDELQSLVRRQEIELASLATVQFSPARSEAASEAIHLTLERAIQATGFDAAAVYMLDDETQYLKTRVVVGLPSDRLKSEPRMLRGSRADLEAMVQDAVLMDDLRGHLAETWNAPESFGAAVCTAIYKGDLPIGTLWLFANDPKQLDPSHSAIAQMASSQITQELSSAAQVRREQRNRSSVDAINDIAAWQYSSLPVGKWLAPGWLVDGMIESPHDWSTGWHMWDVLPDGSMILAMAEASDPRAGGAMIAATARAALTAHSGYQHTPHQMLQRINDTLWETNTTDQLVSLLYARLNPETGQGELASAGDIAGLIAGKYGYRPLTRTGDKPLGTAMKIECYESEFRLAEGETLVTYGQGLRADGISQELVGCCMRSALQSEQNALAVLRREMAGFPNRHERGLLSLSRRRG